MSEVSFRGIEKRFDAQSLALRSLDLDVPDGAFLVLLGPSGCGKTTALRVLAGLEIPTAGTVHIGDRDVTRIQPRDRDVAMVFQSYALYPHMTVAENIAYPLRIRGLSKADQRAGVEQVAEALEIPHLLDRRPATSRAGSGSASPWRGRSSASPPCSSWTSRSRTSTPSCAPRCAARSSACRSASGRRRSTSRTTRRRP